MHAGLLKEKRGISGESTEMFKASHGWFDKFKKRTGIPSVVRHGGAASANKEAEGSYVTEFREYVQLKFLFPNKCLIVMRLVCSGRKCLTEPTSLKKRRHC